MDRPKLGDYRIEGIVGVGRTGIVYLATDSRTGRAVALKVLREDVSIDPIYRERFRREGALLAALRHPHVIPIYGMGEIDGDLYIATRLVSGTLKNVIMAGPIAVDDAMTIITAVAEAVDTAHAAGDRAPRHQARERADGPGHAAPRSTSATSGSPATPTGRR